MREASDEALSGRDTEAGHSGTRRTPSWLLRGFNHQDIFGGQGSQLKEACMGKSRDAKKNVKKKAKRSMKEKQQAKREKRNRWATTL